MSSMRKTVLGHGSRFARPRNTDYKPVKGSTYFTGQDSVSTENGNFHYYTKGDSGPLIVGIHGGGYSALTWALFAQEITARVECRMLAVDIRGHGVTNVESQDMSLEFLAKDVAEVINLIFPDNCPPIILIGHSLGGAIAVEVAPLLSTVVGVAIIDIVEGTALDSLSIMQNILRARPSGFASVEAAIQWSVRSGSTSNVDAAKVSMPGQIINIKTGKLAAYEVENDIKEELSTAIASENSTEVCNSRGIDVITEDDEPSSVADVGKPPLPSPSSPGPIGAMSKPIKQSNNYAWRIDLTKTEKYWPGWYTGLSQKFLDLPYPKILIMASIYGLDTSLTVGQMQGKFQLQVLPRCGHAIQEDRPDQVAEVVATFIVKQRLGKPTSNFTPSTPGF